MSEVSKFVVAFVLGLVISVAAYKFLGVPHFLGAPGEWRMFATAANGQPAAAAYQRGPDGVYRAFAIVVLTVTATRIARLVVFGDPGLFSRFGFPPTADSVATGR